jgi:ubiquinone/menaquinone biosynthesis C-methylase UbiE
VTLSDVLARVRGAWQAGSVVRSRLDLQTLPQVISRLAKQAGVTQVKPGPFAGARRWLVVLSDGVRRLRGDRFVDVRELMRRTPLDEHIAKADAYYANAGWNSSHARKPFSDTTEAEQSLRALTTLLPNLDLYPGARLLDFGAGTCWASMMWAYLGCEVIATDVSGNALRFGEERVRADPVGRTLPISYLRFDGRRFDLPDAHVDRVAGIDTLHHVLDVPATLRELSRILRPGGIAAFSEPGPLHSMSPQSQFEMATHGVIENDIRIEDIERAALAAGFERMRVAWFAPNARLMTVDAFNTTVRGRAGAGAAKKLLREIGGDLTNIRVFFLYKPKAEERVATSLSRQGLSAEISADVRLEDGHIRGTVSAKNTGSTTWLPSGYVPGAVNVGLQYRDLDDVLHVEFTRVMLSAEPVAPGGTATARVDVPLAAAKAIVVDLVAEDVCWFAAVGNAAISIPVG